MQFSSQYIEIKEVNLPLSNELMWLLDKIGELVLTENPTRELSVGSFVGYALTLDDCMLCKSISGFLSSLTIKVLSSNINSEYNEHSMTPVRPNIKLKLSDDLYARLMEADSERKELNHENLTSDHILLAILSRDKTQLKKMFENVGMTYTVLKKECRKLHNLSEDGEKTVPVEKAKKDTDRQIENEAQKKKRLKRGVPYCKNMTNAAAAGKYTPIYGREKEIEQIRKILLRRLCRNVILVGPCGCGKTAIMEGLAYKIEHGEAPYTLSDKIMFSLMPNNLIAGTTLRGMLEERVNKMFNEIRSMDDAILFIDDFHNLSVGSNKDEFDAVGSIVENSADGKIMVVLATTPSGYNKIVRDYPEIQRRFTKVEISPLSIDETVDTIREVKYIDERFHDVILPEELLRPIVEMSNRYMSEITLPASAINVVDQACTIRHIAATENDRFKELRAQITELIGDKERAIKSDDIKTAKDIDETISKKRVEMIGYSDGSLVTDEEKTVTIEDVFKTVSEMSNIPVSKITTSERKSLSRISEVLKKNVIGQDMALDSIADAIKRNKLGLRRSDRPIYSAFFAGPTGCGKTITAKTLAREVFGDDKYLVRFDMSEYADKTSMNKLIGAGSGYVGYDNGGLLTEAVKTKKYAVILFDEIEKADEQVYNILLQVLDEGMLTDNMGIKVDFKNTIIIFTSNIGAKEAAADKPIGFVMNKEKKREEVIMKELKRKFPPEFINRLDDVVCFNTLTEDNLKDIIVLELEKFNERLKANDYSATWDESVIEGIMEETSGEREYGARPIARTINKLIENRIADIIIEKDYSKHKFKITSKNGAFIIK